MFHLLDEGEHDGLLVESIGQPSWTDVKTRFASDLDLFCGVDLSVPGAARPAAGQWVIAAQDANGVQFGRNLLGIYIMREVGGDGPRCYRY